MLFMSNMSQETPVKSQPKAELGRRIRHYRERTGLNQTDIERVTGVRRDYLSSIEGGRIRVIYPANFNALHKVLRFPGWEILELMGYETDVGANDLVPALVHVARQLTPDQQRAPGRDCTRHVSRKRVVRPRAQARVAPSFQYPY